MITFIDEIRQQSGALVDLVRAYDADGSEGEKLASIVKERGINEFVFTGMGSSTFVGYVARTLLSRKGIRASVCETKEYISTNSKTMREDSMLFLVSQSGTSKEIMDFCADHLKSDHNVGIITNYPDQPLYGHGEVKFLIHAGQEYNTSSKSFTNTVATVLYICNVIIKSKGFEPYDFSGIVSEYAKIVEDLVNADSGALSEFLADAAYVCYIGGGASYCTAHQAELITEEAANMFSTRYLPAQFLHGPIELINERFYAIAFDFSDETRAEIDRAVDSVISFGGKICVLTNRDIELDDPRFLSIKIPVENEFYAPLVEIVPIELFINQLGLKRGKNPGILSRVHK